MFDIKGIRTFATSAKDLDKAVEFYTNVIGGQIVRKVDPTDEQKQAGQVKEVDVRLGNFEVHLFDASVKPRAVDPHHTLNIPWQEKDKALKALQDFLAMQGIENRPQKVRHASLPRICACPSASFDGQATPVAARPRAAQALPGPETRPRRARTDATNAARSASQDWAREGSHPRATCPPKKRMADKQGVTWR